MIERVFLVVLDSFGIGSMPDSARYGDAGANTLSSILRSEKFSAENMKKLGLFNTDGREEPGVDAPCGAYARMTERSNGKDTIIGHWEMCGVISEHDMPTYPNGFPSEILAEFSRRTGRGVLCNRPYSGTAVIADYGKEHVRTGKWIVYTSADSVFQIAAHEDVVPIEELYRACEIARELLQGENGVGRVIARPFTGEHPYTRTPRRHDYALLPPHKTTLDVLKEAGLDVIAVGKISDVFAGQGVTETIKTSGNTDGMQKMFDVQKKDFRGLAFINLVDTDMIYGHRRDIDGYAAAIAEFDRFLPAFYAGMRAGDVLMITGDHGCDPGYKGTDHTREYTPLLVCGAPIRPVNLGTRRSFADIGATVADWFSADSPLAGESFAEAVTKTDPAELATLAARAMQRAYAPYSGCKVGAALLARSGRVYLGCNVENASFSPTICAERAAFAAAISAGERAFDAIAVTGGKDGIVKGEFLPCGVCRQVMREFCPPYFPIHAVGAGGSVRTYTLSELLPNSFGSEQM